jgi:uncharacterized RDD family membrane protein YckC
MTWQTPEGDRPRDPSNLADPPTPEPDAETARVPLEEVTPPDVPPPSEPLEPTRPAEPAAPAQPPAGLISAAPVGWTPPDQGASGDAPPDGPPVAWAAPVAAAAPATVTEGWVIAGVFSRLVAYCADLLLLGSANLAVNGVLGLYNEGRDATIALAVSVLFIVVDALYFIGLWTSGWRATLGMRLLKLRILGVNDAAPLSLNSALLRWLALTGAVSIFTLVPGIGGYVGLIAIVWALALLITTGTDRLHQGLHDRWAGSVVVQPAPGGSGAAVVTCLVLVVLVAFVLPVIALALAGDQLRDILSQIGNSI